MTAEPEPTGPTPDSPSSFPEAPPLDLERRRLGVTASEIGAVLGLDEYDDAFVVYQRKVGQLDQSPTPEVDLSAMRWGRVQETELLIAYCELTKRRIVRPGTLAHPERPWQMATPDGLVIDLGGEPLLKNRTKPLKVERGVEAKTAGVRMAHLWGDPDDDAQQDRIPTSYFLQCQYGMSVTGAPVWDVPTLIGGNDFRLYSVAFDAELEEMMLHAARQFVEKHLEPRVPPEPGWTPASSAWVKKRYPSHSSGMIPANSEHRKLARKLYVLEKVSDAVQNELERTKNILKLQIAEAEGIDGGDWRVTWRRSKDGTRTNWEGLAQEYEAALRMIASLAGTREAVVPTVYEAIMETLNRKASYVEVRPGVRSFRPYVPDKLFYGETSKQINKALDQLKGA
jgi:putative phage-type endonuclease